MQQSWSESTVSLDKLDNHLKALLRLKIREFVHLSPWFKDEDGAPAPPPPARVQHVSHRHHTPVVLLEDADCPHRKYDGKHGRRYVRASLHLTGVL